MAWAMHDAAPGSMHEGKLTMGLLACGLAGSLGGKQLTGKVRSWLLTGSELREAAVKAARCVAQHWVFVTEGIDRVHTSCRIVMCSVENENWKSNVYDVQYYKAYLLLFVSIACFLVTQMGLACGTLQIRACRSMVHDEGSTVYARALSHCGTLYHKLQ